jgi:hypothetical protein
VSPEFLSPTPPENEPYGFTEREKIFDRISHKRLLAIVTDPQTTILKAEVSSNTFGEFLFVSTKRETPKQPLHITFWGLGFHDYRERWIHDEWYWYEDYPSYQASPPKLTHEAALALINERHAEIASEVGGATQSARGRLYEMLADLTDEDGALTELEDLGDLLDDEDFPP